MKAELSYRKRGQRWGEGGQRELLLHGPKTERRCPHWKSLRRGSLGDTRVANRQKPSGIAAKESILRVHLIPDFGLRRSTRLATKKYGAEAPLHLKSPKTMNNVLNVLDVMLKQAVAWGMLDNVPCTIRLVRVPRTVVGISRLRGIRGAGGRPRKRIGPRSYLDRPSRRRGGAAGG